MEGILNIYLSNKMSGVPFFNTLWFDHAAAVLRGLPGVEEVFNPPDHDRENGFEPLSCPTGTLAEAYTKGFKQTAMLVADWTWIGTIADCVVVGPDWMDSKGAVSEVACAQALGKPVYEYDIFLCQWDKIDLIRHRLPPIMELRRVQPGYFDDWQFNGN